MKYISYICIFIVMSWLIVSCQEDKASDNSDKLPQNTELSNKKTDSIIPENKNIYKPENNEVNKKETSETDKTAKNYQTAPDIDGHLAGQINTKYNPDNLNMNFDGKRDESNIKLSPLLFNDEKSHYYIQFLVTVNKKNIEYFEDRISDKEATVYVTKHKGLYKYAIARYESYKEAKAKVDSIQKKHNLDDIQIAFYGEAF